jgi:hypothetical protein
VSFQDEETMSRAPVSVTPRGRSAGGRLYNVVTCVGVIKQALLTSLPGLWKLASDKPPLVPLSVGPTNLP